AVASGAQHADGDDDGASISPRAVAYGLLGLLARLSLSLFAWHLHAQNRIVSIRVLADGETAVYQARRKSISGRNFTTLDGARVTLGASDRIEMIEPNAR
ncbi:MAG: hypothetical protein ACR2P7_00990, partial [bacterium]